MAGDPSVGKINVEIRGDDSKFSGDLQQAALKARRAANDLFGKVEADIQRRSQQSLSAAAALEASAPGQLQRKQTRGEAFRERLIAGAGAGLRGIAAVGAGAGLAGAAAFGAFRAGNAIEGFFAGGLAEEEQSRIRRDSQSAEIRSLFIQRQAARNQNLPSITALRERFRQQRAQTVEQNLAQTQAILQQDPSVLQTIAGSGPAETLGAGIGGTIGALIQRAAFDRRDIRRSRETGLSILDVRQQRLLNERQNVFGEQIKTLNEQERQALEAELRSRFSGFDAARQLQERREALEALRAINSSVQSTQPTGSRAP